ncbi:MAG TPA: hypothetical protein P5307_22555 [Pirellulaceae bacterium]|nr:hypothetical protein [Pirellulaceae bacterium]
MDLWRWEPATPKHKVFVQESPEVTPLMLQPVAVVQIPGWALRWGLDRRTENPVVNAIGRVDVGD